MELGGGPTLEQWWERLRALAAGPPDLEALRVLTRDLIADTIGRADVQEWLAVSQQYATRIVTTKGFPDAVFDDERLRLFFRLTVVDWLDRHRRGWRDGR